MISETQITVGQNAQVSLSKSKPAENKAEPEKEEGKDVEDTIDLNIGFSLADDLKNAESPEDLARLLKEGQEQAQASIDKFRALADRRLGGENNENRSDPNSVIFDAVRDVVVDLLSNQSNPDKPADDVSFEVKLAVAIRERDPELLDRIEQSRAEKSL